MDASVLLFLCPNKNLDPLDNDDNKSKNRKFRGH